MSEFKRWCTKESGQNPKFRNPHIFVSPNVYVNKEEVPKWCREIKNKKKEKSNKLVEQMNKTYNLFELGFTRRTSTENLLRTSSSTSTGEIMAVDPTPQNL
ncbi:hypothetical protein TNCT_425531 [Trichonephila clavata]|uniref:Uncharacterized protein n=1 Tax=Trichonephila clavata TaxID=2740835 RepID=A0A8X6LZ47_TRICU|nr:hypothetical protein TNCT_425531 [Trichonephila clavata]